MMMMYRTGGLSLTLAVALLSGCSWLKHKSDVSPVADGGAITPSLSITPDKRILGDTSVPTGLAAPAATGSADDAPGNDNAPSRNKKGKGKAGSAASSRGAGVAPATVSAGSSARNANGSLDLASDSSVINFAFDEYSLSSDDFDALNAVVSYLRLHPKVTVELFGHTDERGTTNYNLALGEKRAQAAESYLRLQGIDAKRIEVVSYGESKPVDNGHDENAWAKNRRVEIVLSDGGSA